MLDVRKDFPILDNLKEAYFDNAATTFKPLPVINAVNNFYCNYTANAFRGNYKNAEIVSNLLDETRREIAEFINADYEEVIFTNGATDSINKIVDMMQLSKRDCILCSRVEHHSNLLPWMNKAKVEFIDVDQNLKMNSNRLKERLVIGDVNCVTFSDVSNVTGIRQNSKEIISVCRSKNVRTFLDVTQSIGHFRIDVKDLDCDYLAFSSHKILGPSGVGILYIKKERQEELKLSVFGGGMVNYIGKKNEYKPAPFCFEAGTPPIEGIIGFKAAIQYLNNVQYKNIQAHENKLVSMIVNEIISLDFITEINPIDDKSIPIFTFRPNNPDVDINFVTKLLSDSYGVALNSGYQCCQPLYSYLEIDGGIRISGYIYNNEKDVLLLKNALVSIESILK